MIDIDKLILDLKINQKQLANFLGKSPQSITKVKQGEMEFPKEWKAAILKQYGINVDNYEINIATEPQVKYTPKSEAIQKDDSEFMEGYIYIIEHQSLIRKEITIKQIKL